jgi:hypothetical protein
MTHTILRLPSVLRERGRSRSAHYLDIQQGLFTRPVAIGLRAVAGRIRFVYQPAGQRKQLLQSRGLQARRGRTFPAAEDAFLRTTRGDAGRYRHQGRDGTADYTAVVAARDLSW